MKIKKHHKSCDGYAKYYGSIIMIYTGWLIIVVNGGLIQSSYSLRVGSRALGNIISSIWLPYVGMSQPIPVRF